MAGQGLKAGQVWGRLCLVLSLLLQLQGSQAKCYFQAKGKGVGVEVEMWGMRRGLPFPWQRVLCCAIKGCHCNPVG